MDDETYWTEETVTHEGEESRQPTVEDLLELCRELNARGAKYLIVGGFAIRGAGYIRETGDVDFIIDTSPENEARVFKSLEILPDKAVLHLEPGEVEKYAADLVFLRQQYPEVTQD